MLEHLEHKRSLKLKSIFRPQASSEINHKPTALNRKAAAQLQISPPILQHSTSIYSLVSPTRTVFTNVYSSNGNTEIPYELYQPISSPPPIPEHKSSWSTSTTPNSTLPTPQRSRALPTRREFERPMHPLDFVPDEVNENDSSSSPSKYIDSRKTMTVDTRDQYVVVEQAKNTYKTNRRHSCSSTAIYKQQKQQQQDKVLITKPAKVELEHAKSFRSKLKERRRSGKVNSSYSTAASIASLDLPCLEPSKSTPTRKVKTYNVPKKEVIVDADKRRKVQELEDLITGRRGSTLKLTLTPKRLI